MQAQRAFETRDETTLTRRCTLNVEEHTQSSERRISGRLSAQWSVAFGSSAKLPRQAVGRLRLPANFHSSRTRFAGRLNSGVSPLQIMPQSKLPEFQCVDAIEWKLDDSMSAERLGHLANGLDYREIMEEICRSVASLTFKRERLKGDRRYFRLVATLSCSSPHPVDLFHNSAAGYRAQYYIGQELGDCANSYAVAMISPLVYAAMRFNPKRSCHPPMGSGIY